MPTNPYMQMSESEKKLADDLKAEARQMLRDLGYTDEQIDAMPPPKNPPKK
jgi:hypothetical protein